MENMHTDVRVQRVKAKPETQELALWQNLQQQEVLQATVERRNWGDRERVTELMNQHRMYRRIKMMEYVQHIFSSHRFSKSTPANAVSCLKNNNLDTILLVKNPGSEQTQEYEQCNYNYPYFKILSKKMHQNVPLSPAPITATSTKLTSLSLSISAGNAVYQSFSGPTQKNSLQLRGCTAVPLH